MAAQESVKLLSVWASRYAMRALLAVELKGIEYEKLEQDLRNKSQLLLDSNPVHKTVPVLIHNGKAVPESTIIVQYVDEAWPDKAPFFPKDPYGRAQQRFWGDYIDKKVIDSLFKVVKCKDEEAMASANQEFIDNCKIFEGELEKKSTGPFFGGESMSYVDILLAPFAVWLPALAAEAGVKLPSEEECPKLHRLLTAVLQTPAAKVALPELGKHRQFVAAYLPVLRG